MHSKECGLAQRNLAVALSAASSLIGVEAGYTRKTNLGKRMGKLGHVTEVALGTVFNHVGHQSVIHAHGMKLQYQSTLQGLSGLPSPNACECCH